MEQESPQPPKEDKQQEVPLEENKQEPEEQKGDVKESKKKVSKIKFKKKLIYSHQAFLKNRAESNSFLHPIERLLLENQRVKICRRENKVIVFKVGQQFFRRKQQTQYKSERNPHDLPLDFSSTTGVYTKVPKAVRKYYNNRYYLFSKFDEGIQLDEESNVLQSNRLVLGNTRRDRSVHSKEVQGAVCVGWVWRSGREHYSGTSATEQ